MDRNLENRERDWIREAWARKISRSEVIGKRGVGKFILDKVYVSRSEDSFCDGVYV